MISHVLKQQAHIANVIMKKKEEGEGKSRPRPTDYYAEQSRRRSRRLNWLQ